MLRFSNNTAATSKPRRPAGRRATVEPMEGRVLMSATTPGSPVTFTYVATNPSPAAAGYASADSTGNFTPGGKPLVITIKDGPTA